MHLPIPPLTRALHRRPAAAPTIVSLWLAGTALLWAAYVFVFMGTTAHGVMQAGADALCNVLPISLLAIAVRATLRAEVMPRSTPVQAAWHAGLAVAFSFTWYATLVLLLAVEGSLAGQGFRIPAFHGPALTWQVFQGLLVYTAIAAVCYAVRGGREAATVTIVEEPPAQPRLTRYLIRRDEDLTPVDVREIIMVTGAQDYSEVVTAKGRHLVRLSLTEFAARLDAADFVRVHRSAIINLHCLERTEPAGGGRLLAHMTNGETVAVSRSGVQALRKFVV